MPYLQRWLGVGVSVVVLGVVACGGDDETAPTKATTQASSGCGKTGAAKGLQEKQSVQVDGKKRTYELFVGDAHDGSSPLPLVFILHGGSGTGAGIRKGFAIEKEAAGKAIFVYPDATNDYPNSWDLDDSAEKNVDIKFFDALREKIASDYCVDSQRVFAWGSSAGGFMANQLACRRGSVIRGIASNSGGGPYGGPDEDGLYDDSGNFTCPDKPVAALVIHGEKDTSVSLDDGKESVKYWRRANGCTEGDGADYAPSPCKQLPGCASERPTVFCEIPGMGHTIWPEHGTDVVWKFFSSL